MVLQIVANKLRFFLFFKKKVPLVYQLLSVMTDLAVFANMFRRHKSGNSIPLNDPFN